MSIQLLDFRVVAHSLAVRRIGDDAAVLGLRPQVAERPLLPMNIVSHARLLGVIASQAQHVAIDVVAQ